jgi:ectoine hydroxylase
MSYRLTTEDRHAWERDGYFIARALFDAQETALMCSAIETDPLLRASLYERKDAQGHATRIALWNDPGDSVYGLAARSERVVDTMQALLGSEIYHYHSKLTAKEPFDGGAWEWHQDYGYWYHNGCLYPDMGSVMVALDRSTQENGCLQVLRGSHRIGRINHSAGKSSGAGDQVGADMQRVDWMLQRHERVHVELEPGDGLFFHANVMHRSDQNRSPHRRWTVLFCFNTAHNAPIDAQGVQAPFTRLDKVADAAILAAGVRLSDPTTASFQVRRHHTAVPHAVS